MSDTFFNAQDWVYVPDAMGRLDQGYYKNRKNSSQTITVAEFERRRLQPIQVSPKNKEQNINNTMPVSATTQTSRLQTAGTTDSQLTPWSNPISGEQTISDTGGAQTAKGDTKTQNQTTPKKKEQPQTSHEGGDGGNDTSSIGSGPGFSELGGMDNSGDGEGGSGTVICTQMMAWGLMSPRDRRASFIYAQKFLPKSFMDGYHFWAVPYVRLMRRSKLATALIVPFVHHRTAEVKFRLGLSKKGSWRGKLICALHDPFCCLLGKIVKPADYRSLYPLKT